MATLFEMAAIYNIKFMTTIRASMPFHVSEKNVYTPKPIILIMSSIMKIAKNTISKIFTRLFGSNNRKIVLINPKIIIMATIS